jgi:hypothetical protein
LKVLLLGNGISRLLFADRIRSFDGEVWGCNFIFLEYGDRLDRIVGHEYVMHQANLWKKLHNFRYDVHWHHEWPEISKKIKGNSGMFLVCMALEENYDITMCGYDFSGKDVYSPHQDIRPSGARRRWELAQKYYGKFPVQWWGVNPTKHPVTDIPGYKELSEKYIPIGEVYGDRV